MSTAPMAAIRPVNSSHWRTDLITTWAASTSGGGGGGASALLLLQAVMTVAMTTMAMAERPARSDTSKYWRYGTSVLLKTSVEYWKSLGLRLRRSALEASRPHCRLPHDCALGKVERTTP